MGENNLAIPTQIAAPRCFVLEPVINEAQALTQAGEHKSGVFGFDIKRAITAISGAFGKKDETRIEIKLLHRRLVPFWNIRCRSHFDYTRMRDYAISAQDSDAVMITIQGVDKAGSPTESVYRVDQTGRSGGLVKLTGIERCVTRRDVLEWIDSYTQTENWVPKQVEAQQKLLQELTLQHPRPINDLERFASDLSLDNEKLFSDHIETIVVPPLETADNIIRRMLQKVMVPIEAATIFEWGLNVELIDLYFRPIFVFEFIRMDKEGNPIERKLEELDALKRGYWVNLQTTEFQMSNIPWVKILKLSADIGSIVLGDIPIVGTTMKVISAVASQGPDIVDGMKK
jgi:hypothetical protein